jgi:hypothetical protein
VCVFDWQDQKRKYDRVRLNYEVALTQVKNVSKKQKVNINKVLEVCLVHDCAHVVVLPMCMCDRQLTDKQNNWLFACWIDW